MPNVVIADTSCFILLAKIGELAILKATYGQILTTNSVAAEFGRQLPDWVQITNPKSESLLHQLERELDKGEASAVALGVELEDSLIVLDDLAARKVAQRLGLAYTGTFGVLVKAKKTGVIKSVKPILDKIKATNFRFSEAVYEATLLAAEEGS